jgi:hypothetical protein
MAARVAAEMAGRTVSEEVAVALSHLLPRARPAYAVGGGAHGAATGGGGTSLGQASSSLSQATHLPQSEGGPGPGPLAQAQAQSSAPRVTVFRPIAAVPFPAASTAVMPPGSALETIRAAAKAAVSVIGSIKLGRHHRAPDSAAMLLQAAGRAARGAAASMLPGVGGSTAAAHTGVAGVGISGASLGASAASAPHPPQHAFYPAIARGVRLHTSLWGVLRAIIREEGASALMRGLAPRLLTNGPASAATLVAYELVKRWSTVQQAQAPADGRDSGAYS